MNRRRSLLLASSAMILTSPLAAVAQRTATPRIGFFYFGSRASAIETGRYAAFIDSLRELGYVEGKNFTIEPQFLEGKTDRIAPLAVEMVKSKVDIIVATGVTTYRALQLATSTIPIVITVTVDPVAGGFASSLSKPGSNFTGLTDTSADLNPKLLELMMRSVPKLARVGVLSQPENSSHPLQIKKLLLLAQQLGLQIVLADAGSEVEIETAFSYFARERARAVIVLNDTFFVQQMKVIAAQALKRKLASISANYDFAKNGGLMNYGPDLVDNFKRAAVYVDKILKGAKAGDLPFEAPTRYHLVINKKTAAALALNIPQSISVSASKVIE